MKKFWVILIIIVLVCAILFALTYSVPQIKDVADEMAANRVPFWLIGLLAPFLYVFKSIGKGLANIFPKSGEEEAIKKENDRILKELNEINNEVERLDKWRRNEIDIQMKEIERLKVSIKMLSKASRVLDTNIQKLKEKDPTSFTEGMSNQEVFDALDNYLGIKQGG